MYQSVLQRAASENEWLSFLEYKITKQQLTKAEEKELRDFIGRKAYLSLCKAWEMGEFPTVFPCRYVINKEGTKKKRVVYSFEGDDGIMLKFIAFYLYAYDDVFSENCYAFRRGYGARDAIYKLRTCPKIKREYCLKIDVSDYFNSIDVEILIEKLAFIQKRDPVLYELFSKILRENRVFDKENKGEISEDNHGAMAGTPVSPFFANVYLSEMDFLFEEMQVRYFRYSDDILLFADTIEELMEYKGILESVLEKLHLKINPDKVSVSAPGESFEFLGFSYHMGVIDLSHNTIRKMKAKIKRKADALRRWQRKKNLSGDKAAIGFVRAMNYKFYGTDADDFSWKRWFFPGLTTDKGLKEIDAYMQSYIRYVVTGRHYKGNYRIRYEQLKAWGYRSLVHEYYKKPEEKESSEM